jgi:hypothetical protein
MHVVCVNSGKIKNLTEGRRYHVIRRIEGEHKDSYIRYEGVWIINDAGIERYYSLKRFLYESDWRDKQINKILE